MKSRLNLKPGRKGTKKLVEEKPWQPSARLRAGDIVSVAVNFAEKELRDSLKAVSGKWNPEEKVWDVPYGLIRGTEVEKRIVVEEGKQGRRR
jgi:hypothetical protein